MNTWQASLQLIRHRPPLYILNGFLWCGVHLWPLVPGLIIREIFNALTGETAVGWNVWTLVAFLVAYGFARFANMYLGLFAYVPYRNYIMGTLRLNMLSAILRHPGAASLPNSPGEAVSRFRGDVREVGRFAADRLIDCWGFSLVPIIGLVILFRIDPWITLAILVPLAVVIVVTNIVQARLQYYRDVRRKAAGRVTGFIAEMYGAIQAVKVANAEINVNRRLGELNESRRKASLQDTLFSQLMQTSFLSTTGIGTAVILILASRAMTNGAFTVGDFALFVAYLWEITEGITFIGNMMAVQKQSDVSLDRMTGLIHHTAQPQTNRQPDTNVNDQEDSTDQNKANQQKFNELYPKSAYETLVAPTPVYLNGKFPVLPYVSKTPEHTLKTLTAHGLTYRYPSTENGIENITLDLERGTFTVVTGQIGSGKTTLLRVLLGLLPLDAGVVFWNDQKVEKLDTFFEPPRAAYTGQVPRLFSDTLRNNILLGLPGDRVDINGAIRSAVMEKDLADLEEGLDTVVGPRGVKLSGGQMQRTAAARMFVRQPELYVFDDLSSALDVVTEQTLWQRMFERQQSYMPTCLVVSHRKSALQQADHIIVLNQGQIAAEGKLDELLVTSEEMQQLWYGDTTEMLV